MTDDELRDRFDRIDGKIDAVKADVETVKARVEAICTHLDVPEEIENIAHVQQRSTRPGPAPSALAAKGKR